MSLFRELNSTKQIAGGASTPRPTLGQRLKRARQAAGLTQEALAKPELTKGFISLLEHDRAKPSVETLMRLATRLGRPVSYFLDGLGGISEKVLAVLSSRGRSELARRQYDSAHRAFEELAELASACRNKAMQRQAELGLGEAELGRRRLEEARRHFDAALKSGRAAGDALIECRALHGLGTVEYGQNHFQRAVTLYKEAFGLLPRLGGAEPLLEGELHLYLGKVLGRLGYVEEAVGAYTRARESFEETAQPQRVGEALAGLGDVFSTSGDWESALGLYERARALFEQNENFHATAHVRKSLGILLLQAGRPREALDHFAVSLTIEQRLDDGVGECRTLTELARCYFTCGDRARAAEYADRARARSGDLGQVDAEARARIVLGVLAAETGDFPAAEREMLAASEECRRSGMMAELVTIYHELADLASRQGLYKKAAACHEQAFDALRALKLNDIVGSIHLADLVGLRAKAARELNGNPHPPSKCPLSSR